MVRIMSTRMKVGKARSLTFTGIGINRLNTFIALSSTTIIGIGQKPRAESKTIVSKSSADFLMFDGVLEK